MRHTSIWLLGCIIAVCTQHLHGITFVYNLRIAETTRRQAAAITKRPSGLVGVLINQYRKTKNDIHQFACGGLVTYLRSFKSTFFRVDVGAGYIDQDTSVLRRKDTRTQMDDILFSAGHGFKLSKSSRVTLSGLFGVPTHADTSLQGVSVGTGHVGVGLQCDASWNFGQETPKAFLGAARAIHFVARNAHTLINNQKRTFTVHLGNTVDLLFAYQAGKQKHRYEIGYTPSFGFGAHLRPELTNLTINTTFIRSTWYGNYKYLFLINKHMSGLGLGFSYGCDHLPKNIGFKQIITLWGAWGINF